MSEWKLKDCYLSISDRDHLSPLLPKLMNPNDMLMRLCMSLFLMEDV